MIKILLIYSICVTILFIIFLLKNRRLLKQNLKIEEYLFYKENENDEISKENDKKDKLIQHFYALHENKGDLIYLISSKLGEMLKVNNIFQIKKEIKKLLKLEVKYRKFNIEQLEQLQKIRLEMKLSQYE